jgi:ABC-2 type transport system permease protein
MTTSTLEREIPMRAGGSARAPRGLVLRQMLAERRRSMLWWSMGLLLVVGVIVASYPSVKDSADALDAYVEQLPEALAAAFGLDGASITTPEGFLTSQLYSNLYVIVLLVLAIGAAAWAVAGSESDGTFEMLLASPVSRGAAAVERFVGVALVVAVVTTVSTAGLALLSPLVDLDEGLPWWGLWAAGLACLTFVLLHAAVAFAVGAATGQRGLAIAMASALAVVGFLGFALSGIADPLNWLADASPWGWLLDSEPLTTGPDLMSFVLPFGLTAVLVAVGVLALDRRDVRGV